MSNEQIQIFGLQYLKLYLYLVTIHCFNFMSNKIYFTHQFYLSLHGYFTIFIYLKF